MECILLLAPSLQLWAPIKQLSTHGEFARQTAWRHLPGPCSAVARRTPVHTFNSWLKLDEAWLLEIDLLAHCGKWMEARFPLTLVASDIATGWSEWSPLLNCFGTSVITAQRLLEALLLRGFDVDNDSALINAPLETWCLKHSPRSV